MISINQANNFRGFKVNQECVVISEVENEWGEIGDIITITRCYDSKITVNVPYYGFKFKFRNDDIGKAIREDRLMAVNSRKAGVEAYYLLGEHEVVLNRLKELKSRTE